MKKYILICVLCAMILAACAQSEPARVMPLATQALSPTPTMVIVPVGGWTVSQDVRYYGGSSHWTGLVNDYTTLSITGDHIDIIYTGRPGRGNAKVLVDNEPLGTFSQYADVATFQMVWRSPYFKQGNHIITIVNVDAGKSIDIDAVRVYSQPTNTLLDLCDPVYLTEDVCIFIAPATLIPSTIIP